MQQAPPRSCLDLPWLTGNNINLRLNSYLCRRCTQRCQLLNGLLSNFPIGWQQGAGRGGVVRGGVVLVAGMQQPQSVHLQNGRMGRMTLMPVNPKRCVCPRCRRQLQQRWLWLWLRLWRWLFRQPEGGHCALESCHMPNPPSRLPDSLLLPDTHAHEC